MIKSLLLKDWYNIKKSFGIKNKLLTIIIVSVLFYILIGKESAFMMISIFFLSMTVSLYGNDENDKFLEYARVFPMSSKNIIKEKFILNGIFSLIAMICILILSGLLYLFNKSISIDDLMGALISIIVMYSIYSIYIPLIYKTSTRKAPMIIFIIVFGIIFAVGIFSEILKGNSLSGVGVERFSDINIFLIILVSSLIINIISYFSAIKILKNKDF